MGKTSNLSSEFLPYPKPTLPMLTLSDGAFSKDPIYSQDYHQLTTPPTTFATPYSPYQLFAEIPSYPSQTQKMQLSPSSYQSQYNQAMHLGFSDQREQYNSLGLNSPVRLPNSPSIQPDPVSSGYMALEGGTAQPICMCCGAMHYVFGQCQNNCRPIPAKVTTVQEYCCTCHSNQFVNIHDFKANFLTFTVGLKFAGIVEPRSVQHDYTKNQRGNQLIL